jgi:hypothetical protein
MPRTIVVGLQDFGDIRKNGYFYIDKTDFIKEWWENGDSVTLINRPRRFGKTLNMSMVDYFFSLEHSGCSELFEGLNIFKYDYFRSIQGTYPVIFLSFAKVKDSNISSLKKSIAKIIFEEYGKHRYLLDGNVLSDAEKDYFNSVTYNMDADEIGYSINFLSNFMSRYYKKKVIILLDEYDTPMQEAYAYGYWDEAVEFFRGFFNATFKTNPYMERALITGITRISKESLFSDFNNPKVITTTSEQYATAFGFTEEEVFSAIDEYGFDCKSEMKSWYDGFTFGAVTDIYNPWSVICSIKDRKFGAYWANTSSNALLNNTIRGGDAELKVQFEELLNGKSIQCFINEEIIYNQLDSNKDAVWSLMLASGYLKYEKIDLVGRLERKLYTLRIPNKEVEIMLNEMVGKWFCEDQSNYNGFVKALLLDDVQRMNTFINKVSVNTFSYFDTGNRPSKDVQPERFYHGFVLGLIVDLSDRYEIKSNRESGFGRYDVMMKPYDTANGKAFIFEFKVMDSADGEQSLEDTVRNALWQIDEKNYEAELVTAGIPSENIRKYGFAFEGKRVLVG